MEPINNITFSIVIPTKNEENQISECLNTITRQNTNLPFEVILVDSSTTSLTREIGEKYKVTVIAEARQGKGLAVHTGAKFAKGKILCFTEADCRIPPDWLSVIYSEFQRNPDILAVVGGYDFHDSTWVYNLLVKFILPLSIWGYYLLYHNHSLRGTNFAVLSSAYKQAGGFSISAREFHDVELGLRLGKFGKIRFVPSMKIKTSARRIQGRLLKFVKEFIPSIYRLLIRKEIPDKPTYEDIR